MADLPHVVAVVPLAVGAAASFALANVAQMRAARRADAPSQLSPTLLIRLIGDPLWLLGLVASIAGFGMQAVALFLAPVVFVQPLIVTELLFALPLAAALGGARLHRREWAGAVLVAAGISLFVGVGQPRGEGSTATTFDWVITSVSVLAALIVTIGIAEARPHRPTLRASALAAAASICFGYMSVLTRVVGHQFADHGIRALGYAQPWMLAVVAIGGLMLSQTAFRIAPLSVSLPIIDIGEPAVASMLGVLILGESVQLTAGTMLGVVVSGVAIVTGVGLLDTSPMVREAQLTISQQLSDTNTVSEST
jgi:drug/metabolite transporter (DMT)-like permease